MPPAYRKRFTGRLHEVRAPCSLSVATEHGGT